jgi:transcriptional regulator with XRE-family HTH domain
MGIDFERGSVDIDQHQDKMNVAADEADRSDERLVSPVILLNEPNDLPLGKGRRRVKSSLRLRYEAETHVIERKIGDLESIREKLGLSQRKMAQLLLVDPSAWTRWTKGEDAAPPHIFRMLQWYLALEEKYPALDVNFWLKTVSQVSENLAQSQKAERERRETDKRLQAIESSHANLHVGLATQALGTRRFIIVAISTALFIGLMIGFVAAHAF